MYLSREESCAELLEAAKAVWEHRGEIFEAPEQVAPDTPLGAALLKLYSAIAKVEHSATKEKGRSA